MVQTQDKHLNKHLRYKRGINMKIELLHVFNGYRKFHLGFMTICTKQLNRSKSCLCLFSYFRTTL